MRPAHLDALCALVSKDRRHIHSVLPADSKLLTWRGVGVGVTPGMHVGPEGGGPVTRGGDRVAPGLTAATPRLQRGVLVCPTPALKARCGLPGPPGL